MFFFYFSDEGWLFFVTRVKCDLDFGIDPSLLRKWICHSPSHIQSIQTSSLRLFRMSTMMRLHHRTSTSIDVWDRSEEKTNPQETPVQPERHAFDHLKVELSLFVVHFIVPCLINVSIVLDFVSMVVQCQLWRFVSTEHVDLFLLVRIVTEENGNDQQHFVDISVFCREKSRSLNGLKLMQNRMKTFSTKSFGL